MNLKDNKEGQEKDKDLKKQTSKSLAYEILKDYKTENTTLKVLLGLSIIVNIIIILLKS